MPATNTKPEPAVKPATTDRRTRVMRELKLALVDRMEQQQSGGFDPYDAREGRGHTSCWEQRRR